MVRIDKIYTRSGDSGETGLVGGKRVPKDSLRVDAYGDIDELNSFLGLARTRAGQEHQKKYVERLAVIQNTLFDLGAVLATHPDDVASSAACDFSKQTKMLESWIDDLNENLPELPSFVLPGGTELNGILHICRSVCRRAERNAIRLRHTERVPDAIVPYLNRLGDFLFVMARSAAAQTKTEEYLWNPDPNLTRTE